MEETTTTGPSPAPRHHHRPHLPTPFLHDRVIGALVGSALGDAIGLYTEFLTSEQSKRAYPSGQFTLLPPNTTRFVKDNHRNKHKLREWTDDTDHALLILLSFLHSDGRSLDPRDFASRLRTWVQMGLRALDTLPLGLGSTVGTVVHSKKFPDDPEGAAREVWLRGNRQVAPNGSLMRTHPLGLMCIDKTLEETFRVATDYSLVTHVDPRCLVSCAIGTGLVRGLVRNEIVCEEDVDRMIDAGLRWYNNTWWEDCCSRDENRRSDPVVDLAELNRYARAVNLTALNLDERGKIGYVYKTLGSGILLLRQAMQRMAAPGSEGGGGGGPTMKTQLALFENLITPLIMEGGDADTNACFAGALLGSLLGYKALPPHWRDGLLHGEWFLRKAEGLCQTLAITEGSYIGSEDRDTRLDGGRGFLTEDDIERRVMELYARMTGANANANANEEPKDKAEEAGWRRFLRRSIGGPN